MPSWAQQALLASDEINAQVLPLEQALRALRTAAVDVVVVSGDDDSGALSYRYDPARDGAKLARLQLDALLQAAQGRVDPVITVDETHSESGGRYIDFLLPGLIGLNLMGSSMWGMGYAVVWDRKRQLLKRYAATPMRRTHYLLSFMLSRLLFMIAEVAALLAFGWLVFDVQIHGSLLGVGVAALLGSLCFAGLSLLIAARVQSVEAANGWMNFVQLPMWLLSGAFFAYQRFPEWLHPAIQALPLTALNDALRALINDGAPLASTWYNLLILLAWSLASYFVALKIFRWQ